MQDAVVKKIPQSESSSEKREEEKEKISPLQANVRSHYDRVFRGILKEITSYAKNPDLALLRSAYKFAYEAHKNQLRKSGAPYIEHCLEVAKILTELRMDTITVAAGLLHDVVEDTGVSIDEVKEKFGEEIGQLVDGVTKISELKFQSQAEKQAENFRKMIFSMARDLRVIMIKFADRLHNMRTIQYLPPKKIERIALETREVYAPLAHRFGIARIKWELEDLSLKALDPAAYAEIVKKVAERREERERYIHKVVGPIKKELAKHGIKAEITGRPKSIYSIYRKMKMRNKPFEEIYDLLAVRIVVDKVDECYFALGIVHTLFNPIHERFKDYIATPKLNMYQSLHTTVVGPEGKMLEIQVRTTKMHRVAEIGIAAHWKYKEGRQNEDELDRYSSWLRGMINWQKDILEPEEYLDILKTDLFISEIFVFTPKGDLIKLPIGSTPVDFAFAVHTDIGFHCIGAKVNGRIVPLNTKLRSGDSVEIITSANQRPHQDWINFVKTSRAKSKIKRWLREARLQEAVKLGEEIITKSLKRYHIRRSKDRLLELAKEMGKTSLDQLYAELGQGELSLHKVVESLFPEKPLSESKVEKENLFRHFVSKARGATKGVRVQGMGHFLIRFAQCCHPVPGDSIVGFITKGRGIVVHRRDCPNALKLMENPERNIEVSWDVEDGAAFLVQLHLLATGRKDFLKDVTESISAMETNILKVNMNTEASIISAYMILEVKDLSHLNKIMHRLRRIKGIISVERGSGDETTMDIS
ncbi:MAG: (p)ppGpp synthetase [Candidatus Neomarinimicrobiota bacterium]|nr:MAG: (p)ppGpp synthetase [Candidatus Neomarinimicrobiota bacterium]